MKKSALAAATLTTLLWSGSYIVNRLAFAEGIGPLTLSGLRYFTASLVLMLALRETNPERPALPLFKAFCIGLVSYVMGQGFQYIGQSYLTPTMASMILNGGMILFIVLIDRIQLRESVNKSVYVKVMLLLGGMLLYFSPWGAVPQRISAPGVLFMAMASLGAALNVTINRYMLKNRNVRIKELSVRPMFFGGTVMLLAGVLSEPMPLWSGKLALFIAYLSLVSGATGFALWVWSQQFLTSMQSGSINTAMLIEITLLDVLLFSRVVSGVQWVGIGAVFIAIVAIQVTRDGDGRR